VEECLRESGIQEGLVLVIVSLALPATPYCADAVYRFAALHNPDVGEPYSFPRKYSKAVMSV